MIDIKNSIVQRIISEDLDSRNIKLFIKRDDLLHHDISGNKWRKLKYNVERCRQNKNSGILTFGGAYSNHLIATAVACDVAGIKSIGIVRGDELNHESNSTLQRCHQFGMKLIFVNREEYKLRYERSYHAHLLISNPNYLIVEEGGANYYGMIGCQEILKEIKEPFDHLFVAQGTTTTSCGLGLGLLPHQQLHVVPALKGFDSKAEMKTLLMKSGFANEVVKELLDKTTVYPAYHFGGYGKYTKELLLFIQKFYQNH
ncbi:MAG: pyridoxal-phosphate dependent enzyme, partial [Crocinitomicaceae bacterium]|nr:pyridoxal-phosphate dependent enzyme [Crocinitomicaceae bacterium]